ncbi:hypothetical protein, partial [Thiolapillus sp.]
ALNSAEWVRRFLLIAFLLSSLLFLKESTYLRPVFVQSMGSSSTQPNFIVKQQHGSQWPHWKYTKWLNGACGAP